MENDKEKELFGFDSGLGSQENPIQLQEVTVYGKRPNWFKRNIINPINRNVLRPVGLFVNDEIFLNKGNVRVKNALAHPKAMDAVLEGGNIAGAIVAAPFAAYAAAETAPIWMPTIRTMGQAMTPSTWIGGVSLAAGYTAPGWLLNGADFAATTYFANLARKDIDREGLNFKTGGMNALLSLAPFTRDTEAINAVSNTLRFPMRSVTSFVDDVRTVRDSFSRPEAVLARELNRSIDNTRFINVPIEHVSHNGLTEGAGLNAASSSDVGFHFSPVGSSTTPIIQRATNAPYVRTGTWSYTNNTLPIFVLDRGNWSYKFNPDIYAGLNPGTTTYENALALSQRNPNYTYTNLYEGLGATSFMTVLPNSGLVLSKNVQVSPRVALTRALSVNHPTNLEGRLFYTNGLLMAEGATPANYDIDTFGAPAYRLQGLVYDQAVSPFVEDVRSMYNSDWYANRLKLHGFSPDLIALMLAKASANIDNTQYFVTLEALPDGWIGGSGTDDLTGVHAVALNGNYSNHPSGNTIIHETGHTSQVGIDEINRTNSAISDLVYKSIDFATLTPNEAENVKYFLLKYPDGSTELGGQIRNALVTMYKNNWTPELYLNSTAFQSDFDLQKVANVIPQETLATILKYALSLAPITLLSSNDQTAQRSS